MKITSATFMRGLSGTDDILEDGVPQVAFIGRSNVGKSSVINSLTGQEGLARTSSFPGRTQEINVFLINKSLYLLDLPGYGYAQASREGRERLQKLIYWYLFDSPYTQKKVALIIDANVGPTKDDLAMLRGLIDHGKNILIVANKIDKIKKSEYALKLRDLATTMFGNPIIPYSAKEGIGIENLVDAILK
jgi:GTP-binding protein